MGQNLAAFSDNQGRFYIFDKGRIFEAEYLPVKDFKVGGNCILFVDSRSQLKIYYNGLISTLSVSSPDKYEVYDNLAVFSTGGIVKIHDGGRIVTISTNAVNYLAEDSLVTFYDQSKELLAVYYEKRITMLEDGLAGSPGNNFKAGDNLVAYVSSRTQDFKVFYQGQTTFLEPFLSGGSFKTGRDIVAYVNRGETSLKVFYKGENFTIEDFPPQKWQTGDGILAYVDHTGSFKVFSNGESTNITSYEPDFFQVRNGMIIFGDQGYFKVWYKNEIYTLETYTPNDWQAEWNTIVYRDLNKNVKVFSKGESRILTYDLVDEIYLYRDVIVVNKGMNNHNVYWEGRKY